MFRCRLISAPAFGLLCVPPFRVSLLRLQSAITGCPLGVQIDLEYRAATGEYELRGRRFSPSAERYYLLLVFGFSALGAEKPNTEDGKYHAAVRPERSRSHVLSEVEGGRPESV